MSEQTRGNAPNYDNYVNKKTAKPCRTCTDFKSWMQAHPKASLQTSAESSAKPHECPLDKDELGRNTWSFLHTMAAYFPVKPTSNQQSDMKSFINKFSKFYPCEHCAADLRVDLQDSPPNTTSQQALCLWFCEIHNRVNKKLGKPMFDCTKVSERWLDGWKDGSCD